MSAVTCIAPPRQVPPSGHAEQLPSGSWRAKAGICPPRRATSGTCRCPAEFFHAAALFPMCEPHPGAELGRRFDAARGRWPDFSADRDGIPRHRGDHGATDQPAKRRIAGLPLDQPGDLGTVLRVLHLVFNEGYSGNVDLAAEAIRLTLTAPCGATAGQSTLPELLCISGQLREFRVHGFLMRSGRRRFRRARRRRSLCLVGDWPVGGVARPGRCHRHAPPIRWAGVCPAPASRRGRAGALAAGRRVAVGPRGVVAAGVEHQRQPRDEEDRPSGRDEDGSKGGSCHVSSSVRQHHASGAVTGPGQPGPAPPAPGRESREPAGSGRPPERPGRSTPPRPDGRSGSCSPVHSRPRAR
jgi:hypothetical protein